MKRKPKKRNITDRAHRYRANKPENRPLGPKKCAVKLKNGKICGSTRNIVPNHKNGIPSDTRRGNLEWACKSCNTRLGKEFARKGKGRRTRQYNPGATNLGDYVQAAVEHVRGAHDKAGKTLHETPKAKRRAFAREIWARRRASGNPKAKPKRKTKRRNYSDATEMYTKFHGRGPNKVITQQVASLDPYSDHPELAQLGILVSLYVGEGVKMEGREGMVPKTVQGADNPWVRVIEFKRKPPDVCGEPGGKQLYLVGGDQDLGDSAKSLGVDPGKDLQDLGFCYRIEYFTQKKFDNFQPVYYWHLLGEETGVYPRLIYDRRRKLLFLTGGEYIVKPEGIVN